MIRSRILAAGLTSHYSSLTSQIMCNPVPRSQLSIAAATAALLFSSHASGGQSPNKPIVRVGPNVYVSTDRAKTGLNEVVLATDPTNSQRLLVCAQTDYLVGHANTFGYISTDGGKTWGGGVESSDFNSGDPACAFGPDGT